MITREMEQRLRLEAADVLHQTGFPLTATELESIAVADFGLSHPYEEGAQILTLFATDRISAKLIVLLPNQILPEHWHPPVGDDPGKEETIRGYWGTTLCFTEGGDAPPSEEAPQDKAQYFTATERHTLEPASQILIPPGQKHWLKGGPHGGVVLSFSTCVRDILDEFSDPAIVRTTQVIDD